MVKVGAPKHDPVPIGEVATPVFAHLPDPESLFATRAQRFRKLAAGNDLGPYLLFLGSLCDTQHRLQAELPAPDLPQPAAIARAREFAMPAIDRGRCLAGSVVAATVAGMVSLAEDMDMPETAAAALASIGAADLPKRHEMARAVFAHAIPSGEIAEHGFIAAALQVHFARLAAGLDAASLVSVGDGACPVCGGPPAASMVVGWRSAHGSRYCGCWLCGTLWNYVRVKCTLCASTKGIAYQEIGGGPGTIKAETCASCRSYVKILHQHKDPGADIIADDVASLGVDLLMRETGFRRGGFNPFLLGY